MTGEKVTIKFHTSYRHTSPSSQGAKRWQWMQWILYLPINRNFFGIESNHSQDGTHRMQSSGHYLFIALSRAFELRFPFLDPDCYAKPFQYHS
jgi:hypothetical protein